MSPTEYSRLMNRWYNAATNVLIKTNGFIDKLVGDEVMGVYLPIFTGADHARPAVEAAEQLLQATGYGDPDGPWLDIGVGLHTGVAYFGTVSGSDGVVSDFTALGDTVNVAARLVQAAGPGEALISDQACTASGLDFSGREERRLTVKGKSEPITVRVMTAVPLTSAVPAKAASAAKKRRGALVVEATEEGTKSDRRKS
jgi:adenylate cyclase